MRFSTNQVVTGFGERSGLAARAARGAARCRLRSADPLAPDGAAQADCRWTPAALQIKSNQTRAGVPDYRKPQL